MPLITCGPCNVVDPCIVWSWLVVQSPRAIVVQAFHCNPCVCGMVDVASHALSFGFGPGCNCFPPVPRPRSSMDSGSSAEAAAAGRLVAAGRSRKRAAEGPVAAGEDVRPEAAGGSEATDAEPVAGEEQPGEGNPLPHRLSRGALAAILEEHILDGELRTPAAARHVLRCQRLPPTKMQAVGAMEAVNRALGGALGLCADWEEACVELCLHCKRIRRTCKGPPPTSEVSLSSELSDSPDSDDDDASKPGSSSGTITSAAELAPAAAGSTCRSLASAPPPGPEGQGKGEEQGHGQSQCSR